MKKIDSIEAMKFFLRTSKAGERAEYYRGYLYGDRMAESIANNIQRERLKIANMAYSAFESSKATLVQKRHGDNDYSYIIESFGVGK